MGKSSRDKRRENQEKKRRRRIGMTIIGVVVGLALVAGIVAIIINQPEPNTDWVAIPTQEGLHIENLAPEEIPTYSSNPPASGHHYGAPMQPAEAGLYDEALPDENMVHSLEHGYVILWYDCTQSSDCDQLKQQLEGVIDSTSNYKVIAMPREGQDAPVIAVTWGKMYKQYDIDTNKLSDFIRANREKDAPEPNAP